MKRALRLVLLVVLFVVGSQTAAQAAPATALNEAGKLLLPNPVSFELAGTIAYIGTFDNKLAAYDLARPSRPVQLGSVALDGTAMKITAAGQYLHVCTMTLAGESATAKRVIMSTKNPGAPVVVGQYPTAASCTGEVKILGTRAYIAEYQTGLSIYDIGQPRAPRLLGQYRTPGGAYDVVVQDSIAYLADPAQGLLIVDVQQPSAPKLLGTYRTTSGALSVEVKGTVAYVGTNGTIELVTVANPRQPALLGTVATGGAGIYELQAVRSTLYAAGYDAGVLAIDIQNPARPTVVAQRDTDGVMMDLSYRDGLVYTLDTTVPAGSSLLILTAR